MIRIWICQGDDGGWVLQVDPFARTGSVIGGRVLASVGAAHEERKRIGHEAERLLRVLLSSNGTETGKYLATDPHPWCRYRRQAQVLATHEVQNRTRSLTLPDIAVLLNKTITSMHELRQAQAFPEPDYTSSEQNKPTSFWEQETLLRWAHATNTPMPSDLIGYLDRRFR